MYHVRYARFSSLKKILNQNHQWEYDYHLVLYPWSSMKYFKNASNQEFFFKARNWLENRLSTKICSAFNVYNLWGYINNKQEVGED